MEKIFGKELLTMKGRLKRPVEQAFHKEIGDAILEVLGDKFGFELTVNGNYATVLGKGEDEFGNTFYATIDLTIGIANPFEKDEKKVKVKELVVLDIPKLGE